MDPPDGVSGITTATILNETACVLSCTKPSDLALASKSFNTTGRAPRYGGAVVATVTTTSEEMRQAGYALSTLLLCECASVWLSL